MSADVTQTARKVGDKGGVAGYFADGPGFVCLGVDGHRAGHDVTHRCMLNVSVANQGLSASISSNDEPASNIDPVGALDHVQLLTPTSTKRLASYTNASVLCPEEDEIVLQQRGQQPMAVNRSNETTF